MAKHSHAHFLFLLVVTLSLALISPGCGGSSENAAPAPTPTAGGGSGGATPPPPVTGSNTTPATDQQLTVSEVATNLQGPWSLAFAPDGRLFFTESRGRLRVITNGGLLPQPVIDVTSQTPGFEGGLTGMDLDRNFASNGIIYAHYCTHEKRCRVVRIVVSGNTGTIDRVLLDYPIADFDHVGGRLKVGPDNLLYLSVGDHRNDNSAQNPASMDGKLLRMNLDGSPAAGNPFPQNPLVYSFGHRDPQGLAWDSSGALYMTDHGPTGDDEVDLIQAGGNYGWPICVGICNNPAFMDPVKLFAGTPSTPPSGASFYNANTIPGWNGSMLIAVLGLAGNTSAHHIHQLKFDAPGGRTVTFEQKLFQNTFGRIRDVAVGPDGFLYFSTGNNGSSVAGAPNDDRILRAQPK